MQISHARDLDAYLYSLVAGVGQEVFLFDDLDRLRARVFVRERLSLDEGDDLVFRPALPRLHPRQKLEWIVDLNTSNCELRGFEIDLVTRTRRRSCGLLLFSDHSLKCVFRFSPRGREIDVVELLLNILSNGLQAGGCFRAIAGSRPSNAFNSAVHWRTFASRFSSSSPGIETRARIFPYCGTSVSRALSVLLRALLMACRHCENCVVNWPERAVLRGSDRFS